MANNKGSGRVEPGRWHRISRRLSSWLLAAAVLAILIAGLVWLIAQGATGGQRIDGRPPRRGWRRRRLHPGSTSTRPPGRWSRAAQEEAEAVVAFNELRLELEALGAPDALVERAAAAADDERRHAEHCRSIARAFGEVPFDGPPRAPAGPRNSRSRAGRRVRIAQMAVESRLDGSLNERAAAGRLRAAAAGYAAPIGSLLVAIAEDEDRHAALADDVVAWARSEGGRLTALSLAVGCRRAPAAQETRA